MSGIGSPCRGHHGSCRIGSLKCDRCSLSRNGSDRELSGKTPRRAWFDGGDESGSETRCGDVAEFGAGSGEIRLEIAEDMDSRSNPGEEDILRVSEALDELGKADLRLAKVVEMRYFAGLEEREIAACLGVNERTVRRDWQKARLLLSLALQ